MVQARSHPLETFNRGHRHEGRAPAGPEHVLDSVAPHAAGWAIFGRRQAAAVLAQTLPAMNAPAQPAVSGRRFCGSPRSGERENSELEPNAHPRAGPNPRSSPVKIIALVAAKGGVGKTTLAAGLATAASIAWPDAQVALVDLDPQGSQTGWWNARTAPQPAIYSLTGTPLRSAKRELRLAMLDLVVVDCPPGFAAIHEDAIAVADYVVIPTGAGQLDLDAIEATAARVERAGVPYGYVLNRVLRRSRLAGQAIRLLRGLAGRLLPTVHQRVAIPTAMAGGRTVLETDIAGQAAKEIADLWGAVRAALGGIAPPAAAARPGVGQ
jgi:chromosome partitioning protein